MRGSESLELSDSADERAVSPVISTILMVAIAVILAATIAVFVIGFGEETGDVAPQSSFDFEVQGNTSIVNVVHAEGDTVSGRQLRFAGAAITQADFGGIAEWDGTDVVTGDSTEVVVKEGETLRLVWKNNAGTETAVLSEYNVPEGLPCDTSITDLNAKDTDEDGGFEVTLGYIANCQNEDVYVDITNTDGPGGDTGTINKSETGEPVSFNLNSGSGILRGDVIEVSVYETASGSNRIARMTATVVE
jgi:flagellin-like protein